MMDNDHMIRKETKTSKHQQQQRRPLLSQCPFVCRFEVFAWVGQMTESNEETKSAQNQKEIQIRVDIFCCFCFIENSSSSMIRILMIMKKHRNNVNVVK